MRFFLGFALTAFALCGCSPAPNIEVTVRSASDITFKVSTEKDDPACIDNLTVNDAGGTTRWGITRRAGVKACLREVTFPNVPPGFAAGPGTTALSAGSYEVSAKNGIYRGVVKFTVN